MTASGRWPGAVHRVTEPHVSKVAFLTSDVRKATLLPDLRLVLLSRSLELVDSARIEHLYGAAALELCSIPADTAADYLVRK